MKTPIKQLHTSFHSSFTCVTFQLRQAKQMPNFTTCMSLTVAKTNFNASRHPRNSSFYHCKSCWVIHGPIKNFTLGWPRMTEKQSGYYYSLIEFNRRTAARPEHPRIHTSRCCRHVESTARRPLLANLNVAMGCRSRPFLQNQPPIGFAVWTRILIGWNSHQMFDKSAGAASC